MKIKDHFLTQEYFEVKPSQYKGILQTFPQPKEEDLSKYYDSPAYISHQTQAKSLKDKIYQRVKSFMTNKKRQMVLKHHQQGKILDIGAGTGQFLEVFKKEDWSKFCIEPSIKLHPELSEKGIKRKDYLNEFEDHSFEVITLWHSLEHIPDLENAINQLRRILKPDGVLFIAVPNHKSHDAQYYKKYWAAWDVPRHLWHFSRRGLKSIFYDYGFNCIKETGMPFDAFYVSILSEHYKSKGNIVMAIFVGLLSNLKAVFNNKYSSILYVLKPFKEQNTHEDIDS
ncbi:class I SAM-dependent methyltransferase [Mesohalobacter halotolerans]|uniref:Class I SAM-dependent methyltransferase n=1 Tax=Mesohalobacter halotolerans TaxID=1883405 RepID=A0A4U5TS91_9FLAO|nr:class I SAM-dependent methyltransferase [Mesohalobacter halotolerans]MBS3738277.1 class I SAM-dependent methyltransferase [Psychroflexus sp.]TKS57167.1 class I SAM-dependent methyltransferase [Mesohalobacter halotolerans]